MQKYVIPLVAVFLFLPASGSCKTSRWTGNINFFHGIKNPTTVNEWNYPDYSLEYGVFIDFGRKGWFTNLAVDYLKSYYNDDVGTQELDIGFRKVFGDPIDWAPYFGGGVTFLEAHFNHRGYADDDTGVGVWVDIGWYWNVFEHFNFAWEFRYSSTEVTLLDKKGDVGGWKTGIILGVHF